MHSPIDVIIDFFSPLIMGAIFLGLIYIFMEYSYEIISSRIKSGFSTALTSDEGVFIMHVLFIILAVYILIY